MRLGIKTGATFAPIFTLKSSPQNYSLFSLFFRLKYAQPRKQKFPFHYRQSPNTNYTFKFQSTLGKIGIACLKQARQNLANSAGSGMKSYKLANHHNHPGVYPQKHSA